MVDQWRVALRICSALLCYPEQNIVHDTSSIHMEIESFPPSLRKPITDFITYCTSRDIIELQEEYVRTFDLNEENSLYLTYHKSGVGEDRGDELVKIKNLYSSSGLSPCTSELPDYLPQFLEFLSLTDSETANYAASLYGSYISIIASNLAKSKSAYHLILDACMLAISQIQRSGRKNYVLHA